jgi:hypothetical protein
MRLEEPLPGTTYVSLIQRGGNPFPRQLGIFIKCYLGADEHTIPGLTTDLNLPKSAVSKALDSLCDIDLVRRVPDSYLLNPAE